MLIDLVGDKYITCDSIKFAHTYSELGNDVFMYLFTHTPSVRPWPHWMGATHADEIFFVFGALWNSLFGYSSEEKEFSRRIMKHWTNFARTGGSNECDLTSCFYKWMQTMNPQKSSPDS
ncbi:acetylcholinesterase-like [Tachypleus tridentatus]|uniref:acetylcholinesterase-like n=1 Tax=Tachypleus tridentatus TaxID=6853 RepID=UPI003FD5479F